MIIVDSHCHLDMLIEYDSLDAIVQRASDSNVKYLQNICTNLDDFDNILNIAKQYDNVFASVWIHPSEVTKIHAAEELVTLSKHPKVIGLGETGLDYFYNKDEAQQNLQRSSFYEHVLASQQNNLPVIIHARDAEDDTCRILEEGKKNKDFPGLIHCFTASKEFATKMLDLGMYISISGIVTFKNAENIRDALKYIPIDKILVETDSPYLAPVPRRGKTNEPSYTKYVVEFLAELKGVSVDKMAEQTTNNFFQLFSKAKK